MRGLIILCIVSLSAAAPQGYSFGGHQPHNQYGPTVPASAAAFLQDLQTVMAVQTSNIEPTYQQQTGVPQVQQQQATVEVAPQPHTQPQQHPQFQLQPQPQPQPHYLPSSEVGVKSVPAAKQYDSPVEARVTKRFFIHSAPEEAEEETKETYLTVGTARKNYNVVFIRAPAKAPARTSVKITPAVNEDKTVIYVLAKKHDGAEIDAQIQEPVTTTAKPEVYFIKYKTPEEAAHAQATIQAKYDHLGGSTHISHEGVASVTSVVGSLDAPQHLNDGVDNGPTEQEDRQQYSDAVATPALVQYPYTETQQAPNSNTAAYLPPIKY